MATFSYADAVKLLGAKESKIVTALDRLLGGFLLGGSLSGVSDLLGWFDAKADFIRLSHEAVTKLAERHHGLTRYTRTQRLHAAHTVIVIVALFEALDELEIPLTTKGLDLNRQRQLDLQATAGATLFEATAPLPSPDVPYTDFVEKLLEWYRGLATDMSRLVTGLAVWDTFDETTRNRVELDIGAVLPMEAARRYEELFRQLSLDCPEVGLWVARLDTQATQTGLRRVGIALGELADLLTSLNLGGQPAAQRAELARKYHSVLGHPILESDDVPGDLRIPSLRDAYVDPRFQVAAAGPDATLAQRSWWDQWPHRTDIDRFLAGYFTSPAAVTAPLLVLGDPGSGKSVLTKVLAAQLPPSDYLVVRVQLRSAPVEADILQQIEHGLKDALKEDIGWSTLVRSATEALPVVLLDGFDELLQATGVSQTDYLTKIARFQRDRADAGHPAAFVVTTRIIVADRATPPPGTMALRLLPFDDVQKERWLAVWSRTNARYFETVGLKALDARTASQHTELSEQPLLLLMLALYDADDNRLQRTDLSLSRADIYEELLARFARREVMKGEVPPVSIELDVEDELERLSIVAFAMFNRGTQWATEHDLDKDFAALQPTESAHAGIRAPLGAGERVLGRFFFVQRAQAIRADKTLSTYEFLHATFGEYLVARLIWKIVRDLPDRRSRRSKEVDDSELYALLSFAPLPSRMSIVFFLRALASRAAVDVGTLLITLFQKADRPRPVDQYAPVELALSVRYGCYSANLVLLAALCKGEVRSSELFPDAEDFGEAWTGQALLWKSRLGDEDWHAYVAAFDLSRDWRADRRDIAVTVVKDDGPSPTPSLDLVWRASGPRTIRSPVLTDSDVIHFTGDAVPDLLVHAITPMELHGGRYVTMIGRDDEDKWMSAAHALLGLLFDRSASSDAAQRYLKVLSHTEGEDMSLARLVLAAVRDRPHDPELLARHPILAGEPGFWVMLCDRMGRGRDDAGLMEVFYDVWEREAEIPLEEQVEAWLRIVERGDEPPEGFPGLAEIVGDAEPSLWEERPDLLKRAKNILAELQIDWPA